MVADRRSRSAGSRLHMRLTVVFAVVALIPTVLVAVFAVITVNFGLEGWFSDRVRSVVGSSLSAAEAYEQEHRGDLTLDAETLATLLAGTDGMTTNVDTKFGRVTLRGSAQSAAERDLAGRLARNTQGVIAVDNQIKVNALKPSVAESSKQMANEAGTDISDSWITTKVKSTLLYTSNVAGSAIDVTTNKGVVSLIEGWTFRQWRAALAQYLSQAARDDYSWLRPSRRTGESSSMLCNCSTVSTSWRRTKKLISNLNPAT